MTFAIVGGKPATIDAYQTWRRQLPVNRPSGPRSGAGGEPATVAHGPSPTTATRTRDVGADATRAITGSTIVADGVTCGRAVSALRREKGDAGAPHDDDLVDRVS